MTYTMGCERGGFWVLLVGLCLSCSVYATQEVDKRLWLDQEIAIDVVRGREDLQAQLKKALKQFDYSGATIDLSKIDRLLESGAGLNFEESMVADIFAITQAEDALVNEGFILRSLVEPARSRALASSRAVKRRLFFGALLCRCRILSRVLDRVFELLMPSFFHNCTRNHDVCKIIVGYTDDIFLVLQRFLITAPEAVNEDVGTLKVLFSREWDIALGACDAIPQPVGWRDPVEQELAQDSGDLLQKRHACMMAVVEAGILADFVNCFESFS